MSLSKLLRQKRVVANVVARNNAKSELLRIAGELKKEGFNYLVFSDSCLHLQRTAKGIQDVIYLELTNNKVFFSKYRYGRETKLRIKRAFLRHAHTTISTIA